jgi:hypothetical protein
MACFDLDYVPQNCAWIAKSKAVRWQKCQNQPITSHGGGIWLKIVNYDLIYVFGASGCYLEPYLYM